jgi:hypothetical protein
VRVLGARLATASALERWCNARQRCQWRAANGALELTLSLPWPLSTRFMCTLEGPQPSSSWALTWVCACACTLHRHRRFVLSLRETNFQGDLVMGVDERTASNETIMSFLRANNVIVRDVSIDPSVPTVKAHNWGVDVFNTLFWEGVFTWITMNSICATPRADGAN